MYFRLAMFEYLPFFQSRKTTFAIITIKVQLQSPAGAPIRWSIKKYRNLYFMTI